MVTLDAVRPLTVDDYEKMGAAGIFAPEERVELIQGVVRTMAPIGATHAWIVNQVNIAFVNAFGKEYTVSIQNPIRLSDNSEPQPDAAVLARQRKGVRPTKPTPADVFLLVEVSNTTLDYDRTIKLPLYATALIPEVWIIDITTMTIQQYHEPANGTYTRTRVWRGAYLIPTTLNVPIAADDILV